MKRATEQHLKASRFFPKPAELLDAMEESVAPSLAIPGRWSCAHCEVTLNFPVSRERGYCGPCWRKIGGEEEDSRVPEHLGYQGRDGKPEQIGEIAKKALRAEGFDEA